MFMDRFSLEGKVAVVTGSATGIGRGIAWGLAQAGASIVGVYHSHQPDELENRIRKIGGQFYGIQADLTDMSQVSGIIPRAVEHCGRLDILVNDAGICPRGTIFDFSQEDWDRTAQLNQKVVYFLSQAALNQFRKQGSRGKIINIASMLSFVGGVRASAYTASKHAVVGITKAMASEAGEYGINVNAIAPGWISTNLAKPIMADKGRNDSIISRLPAGEWGDPDDLMGTAVYLASPASDYVHGAVIPVDGGYLTR